jgi:hypothetical protein
MFTSPSLGASGKRFETPRFRAASAASNERRNIILQESLVDTNSKETGYC